MVPTSTRIRATETILRSHGNRSNGPAKPSGERSLNKGEIRIVLLLFSDWMLEERMTLTTIRKRPSMVSLFEQMIRGSATVS